MLGFILKSIVNSLRTLGTTLKVPDLRKKILLTFLLVCVYRLGSYIPTPGINAKALAEFLEGLVKARGGTLFNIMDLFSGGNISRATIFALGIMPYISASIIIQLLCAVIPYLEKLAKEGEAGRKKILQYTRYLTVLLSIIQSFFIGLWLENPAHFEGVNMVLFKGWGFRLLTILTLTSGTAFIMWLGEQITEYGIGNGSSFIITVGIISRIPTALQLLFSLASPFDISKSEIKPLALLFLGIMMIAVIVAVIMLTQGQRKIPVQYAKRIIGRKVYGGQSTYIPLRINHASVIPIIFASSILMFPRTIAGLVGGGAFDTFARWLEHGRFLYTTTYALLIIFFCYFYTAITLNPIELADNMKKYGGFIPGVRPGKPTAEYFDFILTRITLPGAIFLAIIAVLPELISGALRIHYMIASFFGGTSLLIMVGVMLDSIRLIESQLLMRHYDGFIKSGRIKGRR
ncbi:MAG: preprotein translocase subunit SecY [Candidatus Omnitrophica bacterium]|nr:preprotein translocase subunit SecY [Candidatus Omnitrophota bacterium]